MKALRAPDAPRRKNNFVSVQDLLNMESHKSYYYVVSLRKLEKALETVGATDAKVQAYRDGGADGETKILVRGVLENAYEAFTPYRWEWVTF